MRNAFAKAMTTLAEEYPELVLLSGDIGNRLFDEFKAHHADRFYNCGVAEANMTSVAAGLAMSGLKPVTYTIASFNTLRCLEQIKIDVCYQKLPVIIVGVGAGLSYGELGPTHHTCEDISLLGSFPNMHVVCPGDAIEARLALRAAIELGKPVYLRLGKKNEPLIHEHDPDFEIGKAISIKDGRDICLLSTGNVLPVAVEVIKDLERKGINAALVSMHTVKPLDHDFLTNALETYKMISTIEEHSLIGGLGDAVSRWQYEHSLLKPVELLKFGCPDRFMNMSHTQDDARLLWGITAEQISEQLFEKWQTQC